MDIQYEKTFQGGHKFYSMLNGQLITMQYFFMSKSKAEKEFKRMIKNGVNPKEKVG